MRFVSLVALLLALAGAAAAQEIRDVPAISPELQPFVNHSIAELAGGVPLAASTAPKVNLVYLVPKDKTVSQAYVTAMDAAGRSLIQFYGSQMPKHKTFGLSSPTVIVVPLPHDASYYANNTRPAIFTQFWDNVLNDALPLTNGRFLDPANVWAYYIDADPICQECGGCGTSGILVVSANDLRGLAGETSKFYDPCSPATKPYAAPVSRWIGGLGHELGHAFGLPHPPGCDDGNKTVTCDSAALMWVGYASYPNTYLTTDEKAVLDKSPFFIYSLDAAKKRVARH